MKPANDHSFLFVRDNSRYFRIDVASIHYLEAQKNYCRIVTGDKTWMVSIPISQLADLLPAKDFCRIHRSFVVGLSHIVWFDNNLVCMGDENLPVGDMYRTDLHRNLTLVPAIGSRARVSTPQMDACGTVDVCF